MHIKILLALSFLVIWWCMVGIGTEPLAIAFAIIVPFVTFLCAVKFDMLPGRNVFSIKFIPYIFWLLKEMLILTMHVVKLAWSRNLKIIPVIEPIKSIQQSDEGVVLYANSITLTPGTVTVNVVDNALLVHALDVSLMEDLKEGVMDRKVAGAIKASIQQQQSLNAETVDAADKDVRGEDN